MAISPHVDLDICAARQNRYREVAFACPAGDPMSETNFPLTRRTRALLADWNADAGALPRLFVQSCRDDDGVFVEQVEPLVATWTALGGAATLDARPVGGHTSDWAPQSLLLDLTHRLIAGEIVPIDRYQSDSYFSGTVTRPPISHRIRRRLSLTRKAIYERIGRTVR